MEAHAVGGEGLESQSRMQAANKFCLDSDKEWLRKSTPGLQAECRATLLSTGF
jgi:hypothetical protein